MKSALLAGVFVLGTFAAASAQSTMNKTPGNAQRDPSITAATHCLDQATKMPRMKSQTTGTAAGNPVAGNPTVGDKSARSTGTTSQNPAAPGGRGGAVYSDLKPC
jgi:hypothetical protein